MPNIAKAMRAYNEAMDDYERGCEDSPKPPPFAEFLTKFDDGESVETDRGIITNDNAPEYAYSFRERFQRDFNLNTDALAGVCLILIGGLVFYGLTVMFGGQ